MENKLKLFGAEIGFSRTREPENEYAEEDGMSFNSSSSTMSGSNPSQSEMKRKKKKYECKWCFKVLPNWQALGGHQNAHKKERMMNKMRLQASQAASLGYYANHYGLNEAAWPSDHPHINFSNYNNDDRFFCGSDVTFLEEDHVHGFSLTHAHNMSSSTSNQHHLDLQLGLGL